MSEVAGEEGGGCQRSLRRGLNLRVSGVRGVTLWVPER